MADWTTPKTDWTTNPKAPEASDFNRIENNTQHLLEQIEIKKGDIVDALNDINIPADIDDTYATLANKIRSHGMQTHTLNMSATIPKDGNWHYIGEIDLGTDRMRQVSIVIPHQFQSFLGIGVYNLEDGTGWALDVRGTTPLTYYFTGGELFVPIRGLNAVSYGIIALGKMEVDGSVLKFYGKHEDSIYNRTVRFEGVLYAYR